MNRVQAFFAFWYDFIIGDDWRVAAGVVTALAITAGLATTPIPAWWVVPAAVAILLPASLWPEARRARSGPSTDSGGAAEQSPGQRPT